MMMRLRSLSGPMRPGWAISIWTFHLAEAPHLGTGDDNAARGRLHHRKGESMRVGFIGLGTMGASMALNARTKGKYDMIVNDLRRDAAGPHLEHGAKWVNTAREVADAAD